MSKRWPSLHNMQSNHFGMREVRSKPQNHRPIILCENVQIDQATGVTHKDCSSHLLVRLLICTLEARKKGWRTRKSWMFHDFHFSVILLAQVFDTMVITKFWCCEDQTLLKRCTRRIYLTNSVLQVSVWFPEIRVLRIIIISLLLFITFMAGYMLQFNPFPEVQTLHYCNCSVLIESGRSASLNEFSTWELYGRFMELWIHTSWRNLTKTVVHLVGPLSLAIFVSHAFCGCVQQIV